jgi:hypothetical protein
MNNNKYFDFDEYMAERSGDPFIIKAFGEENEIPNDVPFDVVLKISRAMKDGQQTMSEEATLDMANTIFGKDTFTKWLEKGIGISGIMILTEKVMEMYMTNASSLSKKMADQKRTEHPNP